MTQEDDLIEQSDFLKIAEDLHKDKKYLKVAEDLKKQGKYRIIMDRDVDEPYLIRYYYMNLRPFARITIHHILRSDRDNLHNHPWNFENYIFSGGYWESTLEGKFWRPPGYHALRTAEFLHKLELDIDKSKEDTWTLFLMGPRKQDWGFIDDAGTLVQWEQHIAEKRRNIGK
jgi:hypothetical protein